MAPRLDRLARLLERQAELVLRLRVAGREAHRLAEAGNGAGEVAHRELLAAGAHRERRRLRIRLGLVEPLRLRQRGRAARGVALLPEELAEAQVGLRRARLEPHRLAKLRPRLVDPPLLPQARAHPVVRL